MEFPLLTTISKLQYCDLFKEAIYLLCSNLVTEESNISEDGGCFQYSFQSRYLCLFVYHNCVWVMLLFLQCPVIKDDTSIF